MQGWIKSCLPVGTLTLAVILRNVLGPPHPHPLVWDNQLFFSDRKFGSGNWCQTTNCLVGDFFCHVHFNSSFANLFGRLLIAGGPLRVTCKSTRSLHDHTIDFCHTHRLSLAVPFICKLLHQRMPWKCGKPQNKCLPHTVYLCKKRPHFRVLPHTHSLSIAQPRFAFFGCKSRTFLKQND